MKIEVEMRHVRRVTLLTLMIFIVIGNVIGQDSSFLNHLDQDSLRATKTKMSSYSRMSQFSTLNMSNKEIKDILKEIYNENWDVAEGEEWIDDNPFEDWCGLVFSEAGQFQGINIREDIGITGRIPASFNQLNFIRYFIIAENGITGLPENFVKNFTNLEHLEFSNNNIAALPSSFADGCYNLHSIWLQGNRITTLPPKFGTDWKIENGGISRNRIQYLPSDFGNNWETSMDKFYLNGNKFTFEQILNFLDGRSFKETFQYGNQDLVDIRRYIQTKIGQNTLLEAKVDRDIPNCEYTWYRVEDGIEEKLGEGYAYSLNNISTADFDSEFYYTVTNNAAPQLTLVSKMQTLSTEYCPNGLRVDFDAEYVVGGAKFSPVLVTELPEENITSYYWEFGDGSTSNEKEPVHLYDENGSYDVYLTINYSFPNCPELTSSINREYEFNPSCPSNLSIDFSQRNYFCAVKLFPITNSFPEEARIISYNWKIDNQSINKKSVLYEFPSPGQFNVELTVNYAFLGCEIKQTSITKTIEYDPELIDNQEEVTVSVNTERIENALATSGQSFSDSWSLLPHKVTQLDENYSFEKGTRGVWRSKTAHSIKTGRKQSPNLDLAADGSFEVDLFTPEHIDKDLLPNWMQTNTISNYNSMGNQVENKDILGVYSAELYGYNEYLPIASGSNMKYAEMAFTSFEYPGKIAEGNWSIIDGQQPVYYYYPVSITQGHYVYLDATQDELDGIEKFDVQVDYAFNFNDGKLGSSYFSNNPIICRKPKNNGENMEIILKEAPNGFWGGTLRTKKIRQLNTSVNIDNTIAHSGINSLKVIDEAKSYFRQDLLELETNKEYYFTAWVSINNMSLTTPELGSGIGVNLILKNKNNELVSNSFLEPSGPIIEGWQKIQGSILIPEDNLNFEVAFKKGDASTVWFDDLRMHPINGNMKSYVYDRNNYRLKAVLDENNFATHYAYDQEGNLYLVKKETVEGIKTVSENVQYQVVDTDFNE